MSASIKLREESEALCSGQRGPEIEGLALLCSNWLREGRSALIGRGEAVGRAGQTVQRREAAPVGCAGGFFEMNNSKWLAGFLSISGALIG